MSSLIEIQADYDFYEYDGYMSEVHLNSNCGMIEIEKYIQNKSVWIYLRQCFCERYDHVDESEIDFKDPIAMSKNGVFVHNKHNCYQQYKQVYRDGSRRRQCYILSTRCGCVSEYISYLR